MRPDASGQRRGDARRALGDGAGQAGTSGAAGGTDGGDLRTALLIAAPVSLFVAAVNALSRLADTPGLAAWEPWCWELTSVLGLMTALVVPWRTTAWAPPDAVLSRSWTTRLRFAAVHIGGLVVFTALHVGAFVLMRHAAYAVMGAETYQFGDRFIYELRKDALTYGVYVAGFWLIAYLRRARTEPVRPVSFDIRDGARLIRAPLGDIVAARSAGNDVEFLLADGRRPLMRATLAAVEAQLQPFDFVRTHRSWLVNAARVTGLRPDGSGDWTVELGGVEAPLSRRYAAARERLKG